MIQIIDKLLNNLFKLFDILAWIVAGLVILGFILNFVGHIISWLGD